MSKKLFILLPVLFIFNGLATKAQGEAIPKQTNYSCVFKFEDLKSTEKFCKVQDIRLADGGAAIGFYGAAISKETKNFKINAIGIINNVLTIKDFDGKESLHPTFEQSVYISSADQTIANYSSRFNLEGSNQVIEGIDYKFQFVCMASNLEALATACE